MYYSSQKTSQPWAQKDFYHAFFIFLLILLFLISPDGQDYNFLKMNNQDKNLKRKSRVEDPRWQLGHKSGHHELHEQKTLMRLWSHTW
jgi:hypothetical protein